MSKGEWNDPGVKYDGKGKITNLDDKIYPDSEMTDTGRVRIGEKEALSSLEKYKQKVVSDELVKVAVEVNKELIEHNRNRNYLLTGFPSPRENEGVEDYATRVSYMSAGSGSYYDQFSNFFRSLDRFDHGMLPANSVHSGFTFITRPHLNLSDTQLMQDDGFSALLTQAPNTVPFIIKCLLDPKWASLHGQLATTSNKFQFFSPFLTPACNALTGITGWPDPTLYTETSAGGYFQEDQTVVIGGDKLSRTYDLSLTFKDIQGGPVIALFDYWCRWMANATENIMVPYKEEIDANRLCYTVSIYRFTVDPTRRHVQWYSKATGCFPVSIPMGAVFNVNPTEVFIEAAQTVTIPFKVNKIDYNRPVILQEFNALMDRYASSMWATDDKPIGPGPVGAKRKDRELTYTAQPINNFIGLPYIVTERGITELVWRQLKEETSMFLRT